MNHENELSLKFTYFVCDFQLEELQEKNEALEKENERFRVEIQVFRAENATLDGKI